MKIIFFIAVFLFSSSFSAEKINPFKHDRSSFEKRINEIKLKSEKERSARLKKIKEFNNKIKKDYFNRNPKVKK